MASAHIRRPHPVGQLATARRFTLSILPHSGDDHTRATRFTGLASGPDGTLYVACLTGILKVKPDEMFTTLVNPVAVKDCDPDAPTSFLRGLAVDARGTVYAAATGCRRVVKISPAGKVETVLTAERPWSPTEVAVQGGEV